MRSFRSRITLLCLLLGAVATVPAQEPTSPGEGGAPSELIGMMVEELDASMQALSDQEDEPLYYLAYTVTDVSQISIRGQLGALYGNDDSRSRVLSVDARVGDHALDSTHQLRGRGGGMGGTAVAQRISLEDEPAAVKHALWRATDRAYRAAAERYQRVLTNLKTMVREEQQADDFSREEPSTYVQEELTLSLDRDAWAERIRRISSLAREYPLIYSSGVSLSASAENQTMVTSEGTRLQTGRKLLRVAVSAESRAEDGMDLSQSFIFNASHEEGLPDEEQVRAAFQAVIDKVLALREAPLVEPYTGPAILLNRASGVFFHEIFGHRIEGHRQKDVEEGQTFTKMIGQPVLPEFLSVTDDPTRSEFGGEDLRGFYRFDEEGVPAQAVKLVEAGVLKTFLLSRSPVPGFARSNGHGRRQPGRDVVSRQGNLIVTASHSVPFARLREMLVEECRKQEKPYGYLFEDITGGFTMTGRGGPQAFKVLPVVVYRVHADGRPDELVRGVDIVGTPLSCFSRILAAADDSAVFNGTCGAESGWVPVSAVSPSILVEQIEIEKRERSQERPPLLPPPIADPDGTSGGGAEPREEE